MHGYLSSGKSFLYQKSFFLEYFNVYCPDLQGFGENQGMDYPYSLDDYCDEVENYIKDNRLSRPSVVAHSFGGRIAVALASRNPRLFDKIVLTGSAGLKPKPSPKRFIKKTAFRILSVFTDKSKLSAFYSSDYNALSPVMKESFIKIVNEHLDDRLEKISNETLIIFGKNDKETPPYMAKKYKKHIKNSELKFIDGAGHFCFIDKPWKFNMEVREFLLRK